jgi:hypothetical protein
MKIGFRGLLGIALSAALLAFALRDVKLDVVWHELRASNPWWFLLATVLGTATFPLRARRWRTILEPVAGPLPLGMLWRSTAIGMMVNNVVPARAGELARAYALTREAPQVPFSASFASLAVDRLFDAVVVLLLLILAMFDPTFPGDRVVLGRSVASWASVGAAGATVVLVGLYALVFFPGALLRVFEASSRRVAPRLEKRGREILTSFTSGLGVLRHPGRFLAVLFWTLLHWLLNAVAMWCGFKAVGIAVPLSAALLVQGLVAIAVAVPAAPGFFGLFEAVGKAALGLYGVAGAAAVSWAIGYHILTFIPITLIGAYYFVSLGLHFRELGAAEREGAAPPEPVR